MAVTILQNTIDVNGNVLSSNVIPSGTYMFFQQTSAPTGWTKQTTHDNKAIRVVSGTAGSGGATAFTSVLTSRTPGGTVGGTTVSTGQLPAHYHEMMHWQDVRPWGDGSNAGPKWLQTQWGAQPFAFTSNNGGSGSHNHTFSGNAMDFAVQYVDLIIALKN